MIVTQTTTGVVTVEVGDAPKEARWRRKSAGGQALHLWDKTGKLTTIHALYGMSASIGREVLVEAVQTKVLDRFPRMRGYVSDNERYWVIRDTADAEDYVKDVELSTPVSGSSADVIQAHIAEMLREPLPPERVWEVQSICVKCADYTPASHYLLWRFSHTVADGV